MEFRETLLAAQKNQQQKSSVSSYYKARFDPPKKEQKQKDRLSTNIQKFLAKKDEEEKLKKLEAQRKREELLAMRDPKALRKIQKTLKVIKSANKSVLADAVDRDNTAVTREGPDQPDQDDYGYESQEAAAIYEKMMQKYSKIPDEPKFPVTNNTVKKDLNGTRERVKHALQHEDDPVPHKRRRKAENGEKEQSPPSKYEPEKKKEESKPEKPKFRRPLPPPMDFNELLKLAEKKKDEPLELIPKKLTVEQENERLMTKKQKREYEEEMARRQRRQEIERMELERAKERKGQKEGRPVEKDRKPERGGIGRIPKIGDRNASNHVNDSAKSIDRERAEKVQREKERLRLEKDKEREKDRAKLEKEREREKDKAKLEREREREKERIDRERLERLKAERERIDRDIDRLNKDRDRLDKTKQKLESRPTDKLNRTIDKSLDRSRLGTRDQSLNHEVKKSIDLKSQNTYRIDKNTNDKKFTIPNKGSESKHMNGHSSQGKAVPKPNKQQGMPRNYQGVLQRNGISKDKLALAKQKAAFEQSQKLNGKTENGKRLPDNRNSPLKGPDDRRLGPNMVKDQAGPSKPKITNSFDFDKHVNSLSKNNVRNPDGTRQFPPGHVKRKLHPDDRRNQKRRAVDSESEYDSEMDDFIADEDEDEDYSKHIVEIFGYDKSKYRDMDDADDPAMESSFARQQREEYISKKIGIMEDLEDMKMEAMEKKKAKKRRRISDD